jgi:hypothetical protein
MTISPPNLRSQSSDYPELYRWLEFREILAPEAHQNDIKPIIDLLDRAIESNLADTEIRALTIWLGDRLPLIANLTAVIDPPDRERAIDILVDWLPNHLLEFRPVSRKNVNYIRCFGHLRIYLEFAEVTDWQRVSDRMRSYKGIDRDIAIGEFVTGVVNNYADPHKRLSLVTGFAIFLTTVDRIKCMMAVRRFNSGDLESWLEKKLIIWLKETFPKKFNPTGDTAFGALISLIYKTFYCRISVDFQAENYPHGLIYSLDRTLGYENNQTTLGENIPSERECGRDPLERAIEAWQKDENQTKLDHHWKYRIIEYVDRDPTGWLGQKYYKQGKQPTPCSYQQLFQQLFLPKRYGHKPHLQVTEFAKISGISHGSLDPSIRRKGENWECGLCLDILNLEEYQKLKENIEMCDLERLESTYLNSASACNVLYLARQILPCYRETPCSWDEIAQNLRQHWRSATAEAIENYWHEECRPILGKIARDRIFNY